MDFFINLWESIKGFFANTGIAKFANDPDTMLSLVMIAVACVLFFLAVVKKYEPLLLLPIATGMLLTNLPGTGLFHMDWFIDTSLSMNDVVGNVIDGGGLLDPFRRYGDR